MLLIEPPMSRDEWIQFKSDEPFCPCFLSHFASDYINCVMALPQDQIANITSYLCDGHDESEVDALSFHRIVHREISERNFEASSKVARIVILCALAETLRNHGVKLHRKTEQMLDRCWEMIPLVLTLAIDDHYGLLSAECC